MAAWTSYLALDDKFMALSDANQTAAATALYTGEMRATFRKFSEALTENQTYQVEAGHKQSASADETYSSSRTMILAVLGLGALVCVGAGWLIVVGRFHPRSAP